MSCCASAAPIVRDVGSTATPDGKPTMKRIGFDGYCASADPAQSNRTSAALDSVFMVPSPAVSLILGVRFLMVLRRIVNGRAQRHTTQFLHLFARRSAGVGFKPCTSTPSHLGPGRREERHVAVG